ncbi:hypothetical protein GUJ93_ZPchr0006g41978 [Zizania palustris]|nr:hypothetical protein GUJ93_ZPchr0006g41978 [Zizania palustris]
MKLPFVGNMDPYTILRCHSQEQRSSIASGCPPPWSPRGLRWMEAILRLVKIAAASFFVVLRQWQQKKMLP